MPSSSPPIRLLDEKETTSPQWYSIKDAAAYLDIGEQTLYRWMREGKVTYRKVGDSTRFWKEDLDAVMEVHCSTSAAELAKAKCPICDHHELVEGIVETTGRNYFRPKNTKFWTWKDANVGTTARMCVRCGGITWFGDVGKLESLRVKTD